MRKLLFGDCLIRMKEIPDNSIDMILADLPYGTTQNKWDSVIDLKALWKEYNRILKNKCPAVLFAQTPFDKVLGVSNINNLKYEWVWEKSKATGFLNAKVYPLKAHENILVFCSGKHLYNPQKTKDDPYNKGFIKAQNGNGSYGQFKAASRLNESGERLPRTVIYFKTAEAENQKTLHSTQKPVALLEYLIKTYTNEGMLVLDNTAGSMSTAIACLNTNRQYVMIEDDPDIFIIGRDRVRNHIEQLKSK